MHIHPSLPTIIGPLAHNNADPYNTVYSCRTSAEEQSTRRNTPGIQRSPEVEYLNTFHGYADHLNPTNQQEEYIEQRFLLRRRHHAILRMPTNTNEPSMPPRCPESRQEWKKAEIVYLGQRTNPTHFPPRAPGRECEKCIAAPRCRGGDTKPTARSLDRDTREMRTISDRR